MYPSHCVISESDNSLVEPHPPEQFKAGQRELAQDLITREQQIEMLISILPGLGSSEKYQQERITALEKEIQDAEKERQEAVKEKEVVLQRLDEIIKSIRRP
jgi:mediator of RNA polymerase II transcription subunit 21